MTECCKNCKYWEVDFKLFEVYRYNMCGVNPRHGQMTVANHICEFWEAIA